MLASTVLSPPLTPKDALVTVYYRNVRTTSLVLSTLNSQFYKSVRIRTKATNRLSKLGEVMQRNIQMPNPTFQVQAVIVLESRAGI